MKQQKSRFNLPRWQFFVPPAAGLLLAALVWIAALLRSGSELREAEANAMRSAAAFAEGYERFVTRSVAQVDQISMQLKQSWESSHNPQLLSELRAAGMFSDGTFVEVSLVAPDGRIIASTSAGATLSAAAVRNHEHHRSHISSALLASVAGHGERPLVIFTRRLDTRQDDFDGMILLAIDPRYLTQFYSAGALGEHGVTGLFTETPEAEILYAGEQLSLPAPGQGLMHRLASDGQPVVKSIASRPADSYILASKAGPYPLQTLVGIAMQEAMGPAHKTAASMRNYAMLATLLILLAAGWATVAAHRSHQRRREREEMARAYRTATEGATEGFYMAMGLRDRKGAFVDFRIVDCNQRGADLYGLTREELIGKKLSQIDRRLVGEDLIPTYCKAMELGFLEDDREMPSHTGLKLAWGRRRLVRVGENLAVTLQDISQRKAHEAELVRLANEDVLTSLPNRQWFLANVPGMLEQAQAADEQLAMLFVDLDEFKHVNDTQGHLVGDEVLRAAAQRLSTLLRPGDRIARFGGDEFVVLLSAVTSEKQVATVAERIVRAFDRPFAFGDDIQAVGATVGITLYPRDGADVATLLKHSDIAMYAAKNDGKGHFRFYHAQLFERLRHRNQVRNRLAEAISTGQMYMVYQPRVDTMDGRLLSMEALMRWDSPVLGAVPPSDFIPLAEESGLISQLGELAIDLVARQVAAWRADGLRTVPVSINVSPVQFSQGGVHARLSTAMARHGLAAGDLEVELTESAMMGERKETLAELAHLRTLGIKLHVDDFGTGYSSLSQLQTLRMDGLKVDRAFTIELDRSPEGRVFFQAIVSMAHALGMVVVAEGVETEGQLMILRQLGCDEVQGYLVSRPAHAAEMERWLRIGRKPAPVALVRDAA